MRILLGLIATLGFALASVDDAAARSSGGHRLVTAETSTAKATAVATSATRECAHHGMISSARMSR
jgi:hypothetical protein